MRRSARVLGATVGLLGVTVGLFLGATGVTAQTARVEQDPVVGGQLNQCWGQVASQIAQLDTGDVAAKGGGMGIHTRAAAGQGTTFGDAFGFNLDGGRTGVGNVSASVSGPHRVAPGDGGNGQHAINNSNDTVNSTTGGFSNIIDPLTGQSGSSVTTLQCVLP
jgi:hypothetical protein